MKTYRETIISVANNMVANDNSSKTLFNDTIALLKGSNVVNVNSSIKGLLDDAKAVLEGNYSSNFNNRIYKVIKLAGSWYDKKLFTKHEELFMYNIELGLKVLDYISETTTTEVLKSITNKLNRVKFNDKIQYNDSFETTLKEIMKEYKISDIDGSIKSIEATITKLWASMNDEQKATFKDYINGL
jgi:hypothetical protein